MFASCLYVAHAWQALNQLGLEIGQMTKGSGMRTKRSRPRPNLWLILAKVAHF